MNSRRSQALALLEEKLKNPGLIKHCISVGAIMAELADHYGESANKENWELAGLLHDIDYAEVKEDLGLHSKLGSEWIRQAGFPEEVAHAVFVHNQAHGVPTQTLMERALIFADGISGLVVAATLVLSSKKIVDLKPESVVKRFHEKSFARGVHREEILFCERDGLSLEQFAELSIRAIAKAADELGL